MHAQNTINPIRRIVDVMNVEPNPEKAFLKLHIGDPSITGILPTHPKVNQAVVEALMSGQYNGYGPAHGYVHVREALAKFVSTPESHVDADDITLTSGCSHALQLAIEAIAGPGKNILVPKPGFPLYVTLMRPHDIEERYYNLLMDKNWEADLEHMDSLIDENTAAIVVNNPNNPTGAVYSRQHLEDILKLAQKHRVPVIADEIYGDMVFGGAHFYPMHTLEPKVPLFTCDGISKRYLVPGWRLGWLIVHDVDNAFAKVKVGIRQLAQKIVGPCALMQGALPAILNRTPEEFFQRTRDILSENVDIVMRELANVAGISPVRAQGAMYMMIGVDIRSFPEFDGEEAFIKALISEESLYCLPGSAFNSPGAIRFVMTHSSETMLDACLRLKAFCRRHHHVDPLKKDSSMLTGSIKVSSNIKSQPGRALAMRKSLLSGAHLMKKNKVNQTNSLEPNENSFSSAIVVAPAQ
jgi:tyrosine aminotransferase